MKKELVHVMIIMLSISMIFCLCSCCHMEESYKEFNIKNVTDNVNEKYFTSEEFSFTRIQNVVIIPKVRAINHGEYIIYICAYSKTGKEIVQIKNVFLKEKETILWHNVLGGTIGFEKNTGSLYEGCVNGGTFTEESVKIANGKKYDIIIEVNVLDNDLNISKKLTFVMDVKGYKSFVCPT